MAVFPRLSSGAVTQYPSARRTTYATSITQFVDGREQRFRELKTPVRRWIIRLSRVSAQEATAIESFFDALEGQFGSFVFVDPWDGIEYSDCSFDQETVSTTALEDANNQSYLTIRTNTL